MLGHDTIPLPRRCTAAPSSSQRHDRRRPLGSSALVRVVIAVWTAGLLLVGRTSEGAFATAAAFSLKDHAFTTPRSSRANSSTRCWLGRSNNRAPYSSTGRSSSSSSSYQQQQNRNGGGSERTKRQERVGQLVQTELSQILHSGLIKGYDVEGLDDELRQRISIVRSDVSPDLRQARISVSVRAAAPRNNNDNNNESSSSSSSPAVDRRRAYAWLVRHAKQLRYTLAQRLSHMKSCPSLTFAQVDVSAAVDVMYLIDKLSADGNFKRQNLNENNEVARGMVGGMDFDEELFDDDDDDDEDDDDDGDWDEADDFFKTK